MRSPSFFTDFLSGLDYANVSLNRFALDNTRADSVLPQIVSIDVSSSSRTYLAGH